MWRKRAENEKDIEIEKDGNIPKTHKGRKGAKEEAMKEGEVRYEES